MNVRSDKPERESSWACCLMTGFMGGICVVAVLLIGAAVAGFLHFRSVGQRQLAEQQAVLAEQLRARMEADLDRGEAAGVAIDGALDPARLTDAIRLVPPVPAPRRTLEIVVGRDGQVRSEGQVINAEVLRRMLHTEATAQGVPPFVLVRADRQCLFGPIAAVLAVCREAGARDIQLETTDEP